LLNFIIDTMNHKVYKKVVLVVCDGFGVASPSRGNAVTVAGTPNLDNLIAFYPAATLRASGLLVGLPVGEPGNSEVGHLSIGAGTRARHYRLAEVATDSVHTQTTWPGST
jgi:bisphosphoglycerate-independent phosphoglycerate mutase (AlkP superfamily)